MTDTTTTEPEVELIALPATCDYCREPFQAFGCPHPFRDGELLTRQRACPKCFAAHQENQRRQEAVSDEETRRAKREAQWATICPALYRLTTEGGLTYLNRLTAEQPKLADVLKIPFGHVGLVLRGASNGAKTRSMFRLLRKFHDEGRSIIAYTSAGFERQARDAAGNFTLTAWTEQLKSVDCLFLDDLGKSTWSPTTTATFFDLIEQRIGAGRPIYLTTNLTGEALMTNLKVGKDIGEPLLRRIREFTIALVMQPTA